MNKEDTTSKLIMSCFNSSPTSLAEYLIDKKLRRSLVHARADFSIQQRTNTIVY